MSEHGYRSFSTPRDCRLYKVEVMLLRRSAPTLYQIRSCKFCALLCIEGLCGFPDCDHIRADQRNTEPDDCADERLFEAYQTTPSMSGDLECQGC